MRLGLFLTTLIGLTGASLTSPAQQTRRGCRFHTGEWHVAVLRRRSFAGASVQGPTDRQVDIMGNTLTFTSRSTKRSFTRFEGVAA